MGIECGRRCGPVFYLTLSKLLEAPYFVVGYDYHCRPPLARPHKTLVRSDNSTNRHTPTLTTPLYPLCLLL